MLKKLTAIFLILAMVVGFAACGKSGNKTENGFIFKGSGSTVETVELGTPDKTVDPASVYAKIEYNEKMFYGEYKLFGGDEAEEKFGAEAKYTTVKIGDEELELTVVPMGIEAGKNTLQHMVYNIKGYDWMRIYFMRKTNTGSVLDYYLCAYTVENGKLILKPLDKFEVDEENGTIEYSFYENVWEYTFAFKGRTLTISANGESSTLLGGLDPHAEEDYFYADAYLSKDSAALDGIDMLNIRYSPDDDQSRMYFEGVDGEDVHDGIAELTEDGLFTFTVPWINGTKTYQYVYFYCGDDGIIFTDGENTYYYNDSYRDRNRNTLSEYVTEDQTGKLESLTDTELENLVKKQGNLMDDLVKAFNDEGITVSADRKTGELAVDASVLFGGDSAVLTDKGKTFLNKFIKVYTTVVFSEKYEGFVSKTLIEGHTAPIAGSTYESGLPLSKQRAENVKNYCLSAETGVDTAKLSAALEAVGCSNSKPVYGKDGKVDLAACRRVSFRFMVSIE